MTGSEPTHARIVSATGNVFALLDGLRATLPGDLQEFARTVGRLRQGADARYRLDVLEGRDAELHLDGVLVLVPPDSGDPRSACRLIIYNADGSRPESCGNGLRCVAAYVRESGLSDDDAFVIETDCGPRAASVLRDEGGAIHGARIAMGVPRIVDAEVRLDTSRGAIDGIQVDLGNPHLVLFVDDVARAPVTELGAELERHERFPGRINVEFVAAAGSHLDMRVWERGVGETGACGTGACAAVVAAVHAGRANTPALVRLPGGDLGVDWDGRAQIHLSGPCETIALARWQGPESAAPAKEPQ